MKNGVLNTGWIFAEALSGKCSTKIEKREMLKNEKYTGSCLFQKTYSDFHFNRHRNTGERAQYLVEEHHEPIITREIFDAVNELAEQRIREKNIKKEDNTYQKRYPFAGKIICGECCSNFKRQIKSTGSLKYPVWSCKGHLENVRKCSRKRLKKAILNAHLQR